MTSLLEELQTKQFSLELPIFFLTENDFKTLIKKLNPKIRLYKTQVMNLQLDINKIFHVVSTYENGIYLREPRLKDKFEINNIDMFREQYIPIAENVYSPLKITYKISLFVSIPVLYINSGTYVLYTNQEVV